MRRALLLGLGAAGLAATAMTPVAAPAQNAARDWTQSVAVTPEGGYRLGNPAAPVKLIEYGSLTCSHCAEFAEQGVPTLLDKYVRSGKVSFEFRNWVRDPADLAAAILSRCSTPDKFFPLTDRYFKTQKQWLGRFQGMTDAQAKEISGLPMADRIPRFAAFGGLDAIAAQNGVAPAKVKACLTDNEAASRLAEMRKSAEQYQVQGTPTFLINGKKAAARDWATLEPLLQQPPG